MRRVAFLFCFLCLCTFGVQAQFTAGYYKIYKVFDANDRVVYDSPFKGAPVMVQVGGSQYTGFYAYVSMAGLGNLQYSMTLDFTRDGYYIYAMPSIGGGYSMTDMFGKPYYLLSSPQGDEVIFASGGSKYAAKGIPQSEYTRLLTEYFQKYPDVYRSLYPGGGSGDSDQRSERRQSSQTCSHCYGSGKCSTCGGKGYYYNPYTGNPITCPNCERNHNGVCQFCHGRGVR